MTVRVARRRQRDERGSFTLFTILWSFLILLLAALTIDGGLAITQRERAEDIADEAARAQAQNLNQGQLRGSGQADINLGDGCGLAKAYIADAAPSVNYGTASFVSCGYVPVAVRVPGAAGTVETQAVNVVVQLTYSPFVFDIFGGTITVTESGTAFAQAGD